MKVHEMVLELPLPPSPNDRPSNPMAEHRKKNAYRAKVWAAAIGQAKPMHDPPPAVVMSAHFYLRNLRDEDNLKGSLKWLCDALAQKQTGKMRWRQGVADQKGYFIDDAPQYLTILRPEQEIDRTEPRVEITLRWTEQEDVA